MSRNGCRWHPTSNGMKKEIKKFLTFRASSIGDALMGKYFLENVHAYAPEAKGFMLVGGRGGMVRDLFHAYPWITVIEANRKSVESLELAWLKLRGCDLTLTQEAERPFSLPSKIFARLVTKRGGLYGFNDKWFGNRFIYDRIVPFEGERKSDGIIVEERKALTLAGIPIASQEFSLKYENDPHVFKRFNVEPRSYILMHLFAGSPGREISQKRRIEIASAVHSAYPNTILLTGGKGTERERTDVASLGLPRVRSIAGDTSMKEFINLIANAEVVVSLNTGAGHIASHLKVPTVIISPQGVEGAWFGESMYGNRPKILSNKDVDDSAPRDSVHPPSMDMVTDEEIISAIKGFMK